MSTAQQPLTDSPFDAASTAADVIAGIDLTGKVAVVTGGHSGIGLETTRVLRAAGAEVVVPVRYPERAATALAGVPGVEIERLDLADPGSVDAFAERFLGSGRPLHILVNSAGIMGVPLSRDSRGYESHFATNHLGHYQLAVRLRPALLAARGARVVAVSAAAHRLSPMVFDDPWFERRGYHPMLGYGQSKTANILLAVEGTKRWASDGILVNALMPGGIRTNLQRYVTDEELDRMRAQAGGGDVTWKTPQQGAATSVLLAASPLVDGISGRYFEDGNEAEPHQPGTRHGVAAYALDPEAAQHLWQVSETMLAG